MTGPQRIDEGLECLYLLRERGTLDVPSFLEECSESDPSTLLLELRKESMIDLDAASPEAIEFTEAGYRRATAIVRRHRLAEVLFQSVFLVEERETAETACAFEHMLSEDACDRVCSFLGHPTHCPHGLPIPAGKCCGLTEAGDEHVQPLSEMQIGDLCEVIHILPKHHARLDRLGAYGLVPRSMIRLHQKRPSFVVQIDETDLALDLDIARDIYVRRRPPSGGA